MITPPISVLQRAMSFVAWMLGRRYMLRLSRDTIYDPLTGIGYMADDFDGDPELVKTVYLFHASAPPQMNVAGSEAKALWDWLVGVAL